ncbi:RagB/SusD family nutrient uptake outer membrane protein [Elizabethkingia anophelis]|nr:RagB/SusD family nutrient uptake outer membrane protein [Elizabethkingia anophelis]
MKKIIIAVLFSAGVLFFTGCSDFLNEKSDSTLATPETLEDNQALLDHYNMINGGNASSEIASGDIYVSDADFASAAYEADKRLYTWQGDFVAKDEGNDWGSCYAKINICNTVLDNLKTYKIQGSDQLRGQALALRASIYLEAAQLWCLAYNKQTAGSDQGLPLRLSPDMNIVSVRSTLQHTYDQILSDLHEAEKLLPIKEKAVSRFSKLTVLGYLARTYLYMGDYENALLYSQEAIRLYPNLLDFNKLNAGDSYPIKENNEEVIFPLAINYSGFLGSSTGRISKELYDSYRDGDLRKQIYFRINASGDILFKGNYSGNSTRMMVLAVDEIYLTMAECYARAGDIKNAMDSLNQLLVKRWKTGAFTDLKAETKEEALTLIQTERRKELLYRGLRWADIKRYNREGAGIVLTRNVSGTAYSLPSNDLRYAIAIPENVIKLSGMPQNKR